MNPLRALGRTDSDSLERAKELIRRRAREVRAEEQARQATAAPMASPWRRVPLSDEEIVF